MKYNTHIHNYSINVGLIFHYMSKGNNGPSICNMSYEKYMHEKRNTNGENEGTIIPESRGFIYCVFFLSPHFISPVDWGLLFRHEENYQLCHV